MDDDLREAERTGDWERQVRLLQRAGRDVEARRCLEEAARSAVPRAPELLDELYPLSDELIAQLEELRRGTEPYAATGAVFLHAIPFLADPDPRVQASVLACPTPRHFTEEDVADQRALVADLYERPLPARLLRILETYGTRALRRARLSPQEAIEFYEQFNAHAVQGPRPPGLISSKREWLQTMVWLLGEFGDGRVVEPLTALWAAGECDPPLRSELALALRKQGVAVDDPDARPGWAPDVSPAVLRDGLTLSFIEGPQVFPAILPVLEGAWMICAAMDGTRNANTIYGFPFTDRVLQLHGRTLHSTFGDRVLRISGDTFVAVTPEPDGPRIGTALLEAFRTSSLPPPDQYLPVPTMTVVAAPMDPGPEKTFATCEHLLLRAKSEGGNRFLSR